MVIHEAHEKKRAAKVTSPPPDCTRTFYDNLKRKNNKLMNVYRGSVLSSPVKSPSQSKTYSQGFSKESCNTCNTPKQSEGKNQTDSPMMENSDLFEGQYPSMEAHSRSKTDEKTIADDTAQAYKTNSSRDSNSSWYSSGGESG